MFFLTLAPWSTLVAVGRGASGEKDMSEVRTTDKLYNAKMKRAGSGHELGEVGEELRLAAAGMWCPVQDKAARAAKTLLTAREEWHEHQSPAESL